MKAVARQALTVTGGLGVAALLVLAFFYLQSPRATRVKVGQQAPALALPTVQPSTSQPSLAQLRGSAVLLVVFDAACPVCPRYLAGVEALYRRYFRRGLAVYAVSLDRDPGAARSMLLKSEATFLALSDPGGTTMRRDWGEVRPGEGYLIDARGVVRAVYPDPIDWNDLAMRRREIEPHLPAPPSAGW